MTGHAAYLWTAYGVTVVVLLYNLLAAWRLQRQALRAARPDDAGRAPP